MNFFNFSFLLGFEDVISAICISNNLMPISRFRLFFFSFLPLAFLFPWSLTYSEYTEIVGKRN